MTRVLLTGAGGFLGWHLRVRAQALGQHEVRPLLRSSWSRLGDEVAAAEAVIHVAGVNRGPDDEVERGNVVLAEQLAAAVRAAPQPVRTIVYANSVHAGQPSPYGRGKAAAAELLVAAAREVGATFVDVRLPNLFGEHGRSHYNSFVATFAEAVRQGRPPAVEDRPIQLLHVQDAASVLLEGLEGPSRTVSPPGRSTTVAGVLATLQRLHEGYVGTDLPELPDELTLDLFNTLRAAAFPADFPRPMTPRSDDRGSLVEVVRQHGGAGQTFVSTTRPGVTRGEHFHLRKVERFAVLSGSARIELRRVLHSPVVTFDLDGDSPQLVDMPTLWAHNLTNTGSTPLTTVFWTSELFDPARPDTYPEPVRRAEPATTPAATPAATVGASR